jgi:hypothetical protein
MMKQSKHEGLSWLRRPPDPLLAADERGLALALEQRGPGRNGAAAHRQVAEPITLCKIKTHLMWLGASGTLDLRFIDDGIYSGLTFSLPIFRYLPYCVMQHPQNGRTS